MVGSGSAAGRGPPSKDVVVVQAQDGTESKQGRGCFSGVSAKSVGAQALCAHLVVIPPGGRAKAHAHAGHESAVYVLEGAVATWFGEELSSYAVSRKGDFVYIPPGVPHLPVNLSQTEPAVALVARTDPNEHESVVLLPELDDLPHTRSAPLDG